MRLSDSQYPPLRRQPWRLVLTACALGLVVHALVVLSSFSAADPAWAPLMQWLLANVLFWLALWPTRTRRRWSDGRMRWLCALGFIVLMGLVLRLWKLSAIPTTLDGDEANFGLETLRVLRGELRNPFVFGWFSHPSAVFLFQSIGWRLTDNPILAIRWPWAIIGSLSLLFAGLGASRAAGPRVGLLTAALLATWHFHLHFSRLAIDNIGDTLIGSLMVWWLLRARSARGSGALLWALSGAAAALGLYGYHGGRLFAPLLGITIIGWLVMEDRRFMQRHAWEVATVAVGLLLAAAPMLQRAWLSPGDFLARNREIGLLLGGILRNAHGFGASASLLMGQFERTALAFQVYPDRSTQFGLNAPLLDPWFGMLLLVGVMLATWAVLTRRGRRLWPWVAWWWCGLLTVSLTHPAGSAARLVTLSVPSCFLMALALERVAIIVRRCWPRLRPGVIMTLGGVLFAVISLKTYWVNYLPQRTCGGPHALLATELAGRLTALPSGWQGTFAGAPEMWADFPTLRYIAPTFPLRDLEDRLTQPVMPDRFNIAQGHVFIFLPGRLNELRYVNVTLPAGRTESLLHPVTGEVLAVLYWIHPAKGPRQ
jgi:hypothetical protein